MVGTTMKNPVRQNTVQRPTKVLIVYEVGKIAIVVEKKM
jgi:hypothetical protein